MSQKLEDTTVEDEAAIEKRCNFRTAVFLVVIAFLLAIVVAFMAIPQIISGAGMILPFAMTTGKHKVPPLKPSQIAMGIGIFIIAMVVSLIWQ